jgi:hypothetical protein
LLAPRALPETGEPCRFDLRESICFPYPPADNQGNNATCVAHAFAMALYCAERRQSPATTPDYYPTLEHAFAQALRASPEKRRGVAFEAIAAGVQELYGDRLQKLGARYAQLPNASPLLRRTLREGSAIIAGYQVNAAIDRFHRDAALCQRVGFTLPHFGAGDTSLSGHAVLVVGYDFRAQAFIARNSWGDAWGVQGHFLIPFSSVDNHIAVTDIWALRFD